MEKKRENKHMEEKMDEKKTEEKKVDDKKMQELITRETPIGEIVCKFPQATSVLMEYGLHCIGCHVSHWETLEQGAYGHGMDDETLDLMVEEANAVANAHFKQGDIAKETEKSDIKITQKAKDKIKEYLSKSKRAGQRFRIEVTKGGCAGFSYNFFLDINKASDDKVIEFEGGAIIIDKESLSSISGSKLDYIDSLQNAGFKVENPNAKETCGCGSSFS